jgi:hypothetical protein
MIALTERSDEGTIQVAILTILEDNQSQTQPTIRYGIKGDNSVKITSHTIKSECLKFIWSDDPHLKALSEFVLSRGSLRTLIKDIKKGRDRSMTGGATTSSTGRK